MSFDYGSISKQSLEIRESPLLWMQGVNDSISVQVDGSGDITNVSMVLYENGNDVSSTKLTDAVAVSGRMITTKTLTGLVGGNHYKYYLYFTDSDIETVREGTIVVPKLGVNPNRYSPSAINRIRVNESPITIYPGESKQLIVNVEGQGAIDETTMYVYKGTADVSANVLSGSMTNTVRNITLKTIENLAGGNEYLVYIFFTDGGKSTCRYMEVVCPKLGA